MALLSNVLIRAAALNLVQFRILFCRFCSLRTNGDVSWYIRILGLESLSRAVRLVTPQFLAGSIVRWVTVVRAGWFFPRDILAGCLDSSFLTLCPRHLRGRVLVQYAKTYTPMYHTHQYRPSLRCLLDQKWYFSTYIIYDIVIVVYSCVINVWKRIWIPRNSSIWHYIFVTVPNVYARHMNLSHVYAALFSLIPYAIANK